MNNKTNYKEAAKQKDTKEEQIIKNTQTRTHKTREQQRKQTQNENGNKRLMKQWILKRRRG